MLPKKSGLAKIRDEFRDEAIKKGVTQLLRIVKEYPHKTDMGNTGTGGDNARYGAVCSKPDGGFKVEYNCHPCHAFMANYKNPVVVYNQYGHRSFINGKADRAWFDFITSDGGPWKEFKSRNLSHAPDTQDLDNLDFIWKNGWVWSDLNHPSNLQHNFLVATRMGTEWPKMIDKWYEWIEQGAHPALAFVFLDVFHPISSDTKKWKINNTNKYDWPIDVCTSSEDYIRNFCLGKVEKLNKSYSVSQSYTPVNRIFGDNGLSSADDKAYPNRVFELYHDKYGADKAKADEYWSKKGTGFSQFNYRTHWYVAENEIIKIINEEEKRLLNE